MAGVKKNRRSARRVRDPATGRFIPIRSIAVVPAPAVPAVAAVPDSPAIPDIQNIQAIPANEPAIKIEQEEVDWRADYWELTDSYIELKRRFKSSISENKKREDILNELKNISQQGRRMIERIEQALEINNNIVTVSLNREVQELRECLSNTGRRRWADEVKDTVTSNWSTRRTGGYTQVKVLLVRWKSDDLGVSKEINSLAQVFKQSYSFDVSKYHIPDNDSLRALTTRVIEFIGDSSPNTLLIFYYAGHGSLHETRSHLSWSPTIDPLSNNIPSGGIQVLFEQSASDTLLIYDACHSAETAISTESRDPRGVTELIAACGFQTAAPGVGEHSLTNTLTHELRNLRRGGHKFSVAELYSKTLARLKHTPSRADRTTPVHTKLTWEESGRGIMLEPLTHVPQPREFPAGTMPLALFLDTQEDADTPEMENWILSAPSCVSKVHFKHPLLVESMRYPQEPPSCSGINIQTSLIEEAPRIKQEPL